MPQYFCDRRFWALVGAPAPALEPAGSTVPPTNGRLGRGPAGRSRGDSSRARVGAAPAGGSAEGRERREAGPGQ